ncbi:hypothetical protein C7H84_31630 [Burkholderia sp. Nafp2/4-1b]|nr:hypothetical protein C7H84_31630 [Burkholderia sp. Nafp2/4-1b]
MCAGGAGLHAGRRTLTLYVLIAAVHAPKPALAGGEMQCDAVDEHAGRAAERDTALTLARGHDFATLQSTLRVTDRA